MNDAKALIDAITKRLAEIEIEVLERWTKLDDDTRWNAVAAKILAETCSK